MKNVTRKRGWKDNSVRLFFQRLQGKHSRRMIERLERGFHSMERLDTLERSAIAFIGFLGLVALDLLTRGELLTSHAYYLPVWYAAWFLNRRGVNGVVLLASARTLADPWIHQQPYSPMTVLNLVFSCIMYAFSGVIFSYLRDVFDRERHQARIDFLTGCFNTHGFYEATEQALLESKMRFQPFTMMYIDIDHFKQLNDTRGHLEADKALRCVGNILRQATRKSDIVGRVGGDEFVVVLKQIGPDMAFATADRLRKKLDNELKRKGWGITVSMGVIAFQDVPQSVHVALQTADEVMYSAKKGGRSRLVQAVWSGQIQISSPDLAVVQTKRAATVH